MPEVARRVQGIAQPGKPSAATAQQERKGKAHVGASGRCESRRAMGGKNATILTARGRKGARTRAREAGGGETKDALYRHAQRRGIGGRSKMTKRQLANVLNAQ
jgi:hypothetical protein